MKQLRMEEIGLRVHVTCNFWQRLRGLLGTKILMEDCGLLIRPCNSVHMLGMRYAIDVVYLDERGIIIKIVENLTPWSGISCCFQAKGALEIASGMAKKYKFYVGQKLFDNV